MIMIAPTSRPSYVVELIARSMALFAGRLGFAAANKGQNSEDPWTEAEFEHDPQSYHGQVRLAVPHDSQLLPWLRAHNS